jgi:hypothetical protein
VIGVAVVVTITCWTAAMILLGWVLGDGRRDDHRR